MLTTDSTGHLCCALRATTYKDASGYNINLCASDSQVGTSLNFSPAFNSSMTGLIPVVVSSISNTTTMPTFFVSTQSVLPGLGLEAGAIDKGARSVTAQASVVPGWFLCWRLGEEGGMVAVLLMEKFLCPR